VQQEFGPLIVMLFDQNVRIEGRNSRIETAYIRMMDPIGNPVPLEQTLEDNQLAHVVGLS